MSLAGVYIHIPFCRARCSYCDFATGAYESELAEEYVRAVASEIEASEAAPPNAPVDTIYFGGGTPSLLTPAQAAHILSASPAAVQVKAGAELTLEMNPGSSPLAPARAASGGRQPRESSARSLRDRE